MWSSHLARNNEDDDKSGRGRKKCFSPEINRLREEPERSRSDVMVMSLACPLPSPRLQQGRPPGLTTESRDERSARRRRQSPFGAANRLLTPLAVGNSKRIRRLREQQPPSPPPNQLSMTTPTFDLNGGICLSTITSFLASTSSDRLSHSDSSTTTALSTATNQTAIDATTRIRTANEPTLRLRSCDDRRREQDLAPRFASPRHGPLDLMDLATSNAKLSACLSDVRVERRRKWKRNPRYRNIRMPTYGNRMVVWRCTLLHVCVMLGAAAAAAAGVRYKDLSSQSSLSPVAHSFDDVAAAAVDSDESIQGHSTAANESSPYRSDEQVGESSGAMTDQGHERVGGGQSYYRRSGKGGGGDDNEDDDLREGSNTSLGQPGDVFNGRRYYLRVVQQPTTGSAFGRDHLSRLAVQPPLIVQLRVTDTEDEEVDFDDEIPFLVCRLSLTTEDGAPADVVTTNATSATAAFSSAGGGPRHSTGRLLERSTAPSSVRQNRVASAAELYSSSSSSGEQTTAMSMLYGTLIASPVQLPNQQRQLRTFFVFPEVSVRSRGRFRLNATVMRLPLPSGVVNEQADVAADPDVDLASSAIRGPRLASVTTDPFSIVPNAQYVAPHITELTRHFATNGVGLLLPPNQSLNE